MVVMLVTWHAHRYGRVGVPMGRRFTHRETAQRNRPDGKEPQREICDKSPDDDVHQSFQAYNSCPVPWWLHGPSARAAGIATRVASWRQRANHVLSVMEPISKFTIDLPRTIEMGTAEGETVIDEQMTVRQIQRRDRQ